MNQSGLPGPQCGIFRPWLKEPQDPMEFHSQFIENAGPPTRLSPGKDIQTVLSLAVWPFVNA
jgi:hypothetical protein